MENLFSIFGKYPELTAVFSEKKDGSMRLEGDFLKDKESIKNRKRFLEKFNIDISNTLSAGLVHSNNIHVVGQKEAGKFIRNTDGLITKEKNLFLTVTFADCLPIFIYDYEKRIVGLVHAGWKGLANGILKTTFLKIESDFKSNLKNILVSIGPSISQCHFEIPEERIEYFQEFLPNVLSKRNNKIFLDLKEIARRQLINSGIKEKNIEISPKCTYCQKENYFSYRRDKPKIIKAMMAVIGIK